MSMKVWNHVEAPGGGSGPLVRNPCEVGLPYTACLPPVPSPTTSPSSPSFTLTRSGKSLSYVNRQDFQGTQPVWAGRWRATREQENLES